MPFKHTKINPNNHPRVVDCTDDGYTLKVKVVNLPDGRDSKFMDMVCNQIRYCWEQGLPKKAA